MILLKGESKRGSLQCGKKQASSGLSGVHKENYVHLERN